MIKSIHQSMLNRWLMCGEQFRRIYIEGQRRPPGVAARRGTSVHKANEINMDQKRITKSDMPVSDLQDAARDEFVRLVKDDGVFIPKENLSEKTKILNNGLNETISATAVYRESIAPSIQPAMIEDFITADIGLELPLGGTIDTADESGVIHDLKIQKRKDQSWADRSLQTSIYWILYRERCGHDPDSFVFDQIIPNKTMEHDPIVTRRTPADFQRLRQYIKAFLTDYNAGNFRPADPGSWICHPSWCGFYSVCKYTK